MPEETSIQDSSYISHASSASSAASWEVREAFVKDPNGIWIELLERR